MIIYLAFGSSQVGSIKKKIYKQIQDLDKNLYKTFEKIL